MTKITVALRNFVNALEALRNFVNALQK